MMQSLLRRARLVAVSAILSAVAVVAQAAAETTKLDAVLTAISRAPDSMAARKVAKRVDAGQRELVETIVRFDGSIDNVRESGAVLRSAPPGARRAATTMAANARRR